MLDPWGFEPDQKDMIINGGAALVQPILFQYPPRHPQAGQPWEPPEGSEAYFLFGDLTKTPLRIEVPITGDSGLLRIEPEQAATIKARTKQRFFIVLPGTPPTPHQLTTGEVQRND